MANGEDQINGRHKNAFLRFFRSVWNEVLSLLKLRSPTLKESLEEVLEEHDADGEEIPDEEKELLRNVLTFSELTVEDIMVPRADIIYVNNDISFADLKTTIIEAAHTRIPVCRGSLDDVIGFLHIKDLVACLSNNDGDKFEIGGLVRQVLFVPPSMKISDVLVNMRAARVHMALVVDEYGGTTGIVTMEDVVEEIVGEIEDEHDTGEEENILIEQGKGVYEVSARIEINVLEKALETKLRSDEDDEDFETLGGLLFIKLGRIPSKGEIIQDKNFEYQIIDADPRRVKRVLISRNEKT
jgi:CBS domain containing-hemolysin-like protein